MTSTKKWLISVTEPVLGRNPIKRTNKIATAIAIQGDIAAAAGGTNPIVMDTANDAVDATAAVTLLNASGSVTATVNGVVSTVTAASTDDAATAIVLRNALNANTTIAALVTASAATTVTTVTAKIAGTTPNSYALTGDTGVTRSGTTMSGGVFATAKVLFASATSGSSGATIDGTLVQVAYNTSVGQTATDFAAAVDADSTIGPLTTTSVSGSTVTITWTQAVSAAVANAIPIVLSGQATLAAGSTGVFGSGTGCVAAINATGTFTISGATGQLSAKVGGSDAPHTVEFAAASADDSPTAVLLANKITAGGDSPPALNLTENVTAVAVAAVAATGAVFFNAASGTVGATIAGNLVTVTADPDDTVTAGLMVTAVNTTLALEGLVVASQVQNRVTLTAASKGVPNPAITLVKSGTGVSVSGATLTGGVAAAVNLSAKMPGYAGNLFTLAVSGTGVSRSGAAFTGGAATLETFTY